MFTFLQPDILTSTATHTTYTVHTSHTPHTIKRTTPCMPNTTFIKCFAMVLTALFFFLPCSEFGLDTHGSFLLDDGTAPKPEQPENDRRDEVGAPKASNQHGVVPQSVPRSSPAHVPRVAGTPTSAQATTPRPYLTTPSGTPLLAPKSPALADRSPAAGFLAPKSPAVDQMRSPSHSDDAEELLRHWENRRHQETLVCMWYDEMCCVDTAVCIYFCACVMYGECVCVCVCHVCSLSVCTHT